MPRTFDIRSAAVLAAGLALALLGVEYVLATPDEDALRQFLVVAGMIAVATAVVFGLVVPRASPASVRTAIVLAVLALLLAGVFWAGLSPVLAVAAIFLARRAGDAPQARLAYGLGLVAILADVAAIVADGIVNG